MRRFIRRIWGTLSRRAPDRPPTSSELRDATVRHFDEMFESMEARNPSSAAKVLVDAAFEGNLARVKELIASGIPVDVRDGRGYTALRSAIENMNAEVVEFLLQQGADVNDPAYPQGTPLMHAIDVEGDSASQFEYREPPQAIITSILLRYGADPLQRGPRGKSPIDLAKQYLHDEAVRLLQAAIAQKQR